MSSLSIHQDHHVYKITLTRPDIHNAFDEVLIAQLIDALNSAIETPEIQVILLNGSGKHFSAGADLAWMKRMADATQTENERDAECLGQLLHTLYHCPKPTVVQVQGAAYGGGAGLVAACDIAIAATDAKFCFSEVKLGLIPAVISPFVIQAIGPRRATAYFMTGTPFSAQEALQFGLIQHCVAPEQLVSFTQDLIQNIVNLPTDAVKACKALVREVADHPIDPKLLKLTAQRIASIRSSEEAKVGIQAFLKKSEPRQ